MNPRIVFAVLLACVSACATAPKVSALVTQSSEPLSIDVTASSTVETLASQPTISTRTISPALAGIAIAPPAINPAPILTTVTATRVSAAPPPPTLAATPVIATIARRVSAVAAPPPPSLRTERPLSKATDKPALAQTPQQALTDANKAARQLAVSGTFEEATLVYGYEPGAIYEILTSPSYISTILLEPGETLIDIAAGDTTRWNVSNTVSGTGPASRTIIIVKPLAPKLKTNIVLVTDKRSYLIEASSAAGDTYTAELAWRYPAPPPQTVILKPEPPPRPVNANYTIRAPKKSVPAWMPVRVYDDGLKTWIVFPESIAASDMPPLFIKTGEGLELVNYRTQGNTYEVDRIFDEAELRIGRLKPVVVRILRDVKPKRDGS